MSNIDRWYAQSCYSPFFPSLQNQHRHLFLWKDYCEWFEFSKMKYCSGNIYCGISSLHGREVSLRRLRDFAIQLCGWRSWEDQWEGTGGGGRGEGSAVRALGKPRGGMIPGAAPRNPTSDIPFKTFFSPTGTEDERNSLAGIEDKPPPIGGYKASFHIPSHRLMASSHLWRHPRPLPPLVWSVCWSLQRISSLSYTPRAQDNQSQCNMKQNSSSYMTCKIKLLTVCWLQLFDSIFYSCLSVIAYFSI